MSNIYFDWRIYAGRLIRKTVAKAADINTALDLVSVGFDAVGTEIVPARQGQANLLANFQRYIVALTGLTMGLPANGFRITGLPSPVAGDEPATKTYADAIKTYADGLVFAAVLPAQTGNSGKFIKTDGATASWAYATTELTINATAAINASSGQHIVCTYAGTVTVTLPGAPAAGDTVWVTPGNGRTDTVIARNGLLIMGLAEDMTIDNTNMTAELRYVSAGLGWRLV